MKGMGNFALCPSTSGLPHLAIYIPEQGVRSTFEWLHKCILLSLLHSLYLAFSVRARACAGAESGREVPRGLQQVHVQIRQGHSHLESQRFVFGRLAHSSHCSQRPSVCCLGSSFCKNDNFCLQKKESSVFAHFDCSVYTSPQRCPSKILVDNTRPPWFMCILGSALLVMASVDVDKTNQSYYGEQQLFLMNVLVGTSSASTHTCNAIRFKS